MILEFILFEITGLGSMLGLNSLRNIKEQCQGINKPKQLPIIDKYLKHRVGKMSKQEMYLSRKAATAINRLSKYQAFRYLLVYFGRQARESQLAKARNNLGRSGAAGWLDHIGRL